MHSSYMQIAYILSSSIQIKFCLLAIYIIEFLPYRNRCRYANDTYVCMAAFIRSITVCFCNYFNL